MGDPVDKTPERFGQRRDVEAGGDRLETCLVDPAGVAPIPDHAEFGPPVERDEDEVARLESGAVDAIVERAGERIGQQDRHTPQAWTGRQALLYGPLVFWEGAGDGLPVRTSVTSEVGSGRRAVRAVTEADIIRFLELQPDFLARHPSLYLTLLPPARVHGDRLADHMAAMLAAARRQNLQLQDSVRRRRAGRSLSERVEMALLGLIRASDPLDWLDHELAGTLGVDAAHLRFLPSEETRRLLGGRDIVFRETVTDGGALHGAAASLVRRDVLVRVRRGLRPACVLALGSRDDGLPGPGSEGPLGLLASALEAALDRG